VIRKRNRRPAPSAWAALWLLAGLILNQACPAAGAETPAALKGRIFLTLGTDRAEAYPGERILLKATLHTDGLSVRDVQYPRLAPGPFAAEEWGLPAQGTAVRDGKSYGTTEFSAAIVPRKPGILELGPASLTCRVLLPAAGSAEAFFGRQEPLVLELGSDPLSLRINALPGKGVPPDFHGAVGDFSLAVTVRPQSLGPGDPVRVTATVTGRGSLGGLACPGWETPPEAHHFAAAEPLALRKEGALVCEQILVPLSEKAQRLPAVRWSFFNPASGAYVTRRQGPFPLQVAAPSALLPDAEKRGARGIPDLIRRRPSLAGFALLSALAGGALALLAWRQRIRLREGLNRRLRQLRRGRRLKAELRRAERLLGQPDAGPFHTVVFRALQGFLGELLQRRPGGITEEALAGPLLPPGLDEALLARIRFVFTACDRARYASVPVGTQERQRTLAVMREIAAADIGKGTGERQTPAEPPERTAP
jgi:hypothetical protein